MKKLLLLGAFLAVGSLGLQEVSVGHGGTYRGPGDTVPPGGGGGGGGGGPTTPGPSGPGGPGPAGPGTPAPATPGAPAGNPGGGASAPTTGAAASTGPDLEVWSFWWEFNKDPYLNLKASIHSGGVVTGSGDFFLGQGEKTEAKDSLRPSEEQIRQKVVPALLNALEKERNNDIVTGALIALAKIGDAKSEAGESEFEKVISGFLDDSNQEIAETAAVSLGILANRASVKTLEHLLRDDAEGRKLVGKSEVPYRSRAFAAYGLGLIGSRNSDNAVRQDINTILMDVLQEPRMSTRDVKVACLIAIGLAPIDPVADVSDEGTEEMSATEKAIRSRQSQLQFLLDYFKEEDNHYLIRAHAPRTLARLLEGAPADLRDGVAEAVLEGTSKHTKERQEVRQSCILALGQIGDCDEDKLDKTIREELMRVTKDGQNQERFFSLISLAQIAGRPGSGEGDAFAGVNDKKGIRSHLLTNLARGKSRLRPWAALAMGVMGRALLDADQTDIPSSGQALRTELADQKSPTDVGAYAIAVGIRKDLEARDILLEKLDSFSQDEARGYLAVGLGLMEAREAIEPLQEIVKKSKYRPELLKQAAVALGLLGDKELVPDLITMLEEAKGLASQAAISSALGFIGDSRSIDPLVAMLQSDDITDRARGFAAVALGIVADKEPLPWNSKIAVDINYRANTTTLTSAAEGTGILDIL